MQEMQMHQSNICYNNLIKLQKSFGFLFKNIQRKSYYFAGIESKVKESKFDSAIIYKI